MQRGQATPEYAGVVLLVALVLAGAAAVAAPDLPRLVVAKLRLALCIVGGDVCTKEEAERRDLGPCVVGSDSAARDTSVSIVFIRSGGGETWAVEERSDGTFLVTAAYGQSLGATGGVGVKLGPVDLGADGHAGFGFRSGNGWEFPDRRALEQFLGRFEDRFDLAAWGELFGEPTYTFLEGGGVTDGELGAGGDVNVDGATRTALGRRKGPHGTTYYYEVEGALGFAGGGRAIAEWDTGDPPALTLRSSTTRGKRTVETVARLPLDERGDLAAAAHHVLRGGSGRDLAWRLRSRGSVQRFTYAQESSEKGWDASLGLGARVGASRSVRAQRRRLIAAEVLGVGSREDCFTR